MQILLTVRDGGGNIGVHDDKAVCVCSATIVRNASDRNVAIPTVTLIVVEAAISAIPAGGNPIAIALREEASIARRIETI